MTHPHEERINTVIDRIDNAPEVYADESELIQYFWATLTVLKEAYYQAYPDRTEEDMWDDIAHERS